MPSRMIVLSIALAALAASPALAQNPAAKSGGPQFQVDALWPKDLPNNWLLGQVSGITTDRNNNVWVVNRPDSLSKRERAAEQKPPEAKCCVTPPPVLVFDQAGNVIKHWGGPGQGYNWPKSEHGIYIDDNDFVWLAGNDKTDGQLLKFAMDGKFVLQIGARRGSEFPSRTIVAYFHFGLNDVSIRAFPSVGAPDGGPTMGQKSPYKPI